MYLLRFLHNSSSVFTFTSFTTNCCIYFVFITTIYFPNVVFKCCFIVWRYIIYRETEIHFYAIESEDVRDIKDFSCLNFFLFLSTKAIMCRFWSKAAIYFLNIIIRSISVDAQFIHITVALSKIRLKFRQDFSFLVLITLFFLEKRYIWQLSLINLRQGRTKPESRN